MSGLVTRRRFLLLVASAGAGAATWRLLAEDGQNSYVSEIFDDYGAARAVGREYLDHHRTDVATKRPLALLERRDSLAPRVLRERIRDAVRRDFASSRVVLVDGWYLSVTEARLCALAASA